MADEEQYNYLALDLATTMAFKYRNSSVLKDEQDRANRLAGLAELRNTWVPTIKDECLRHYVDKWMAVKESVVREIRIGVDDWAERQRKAEQEKAALAAKLGVQR